MIFVYFMGKLSFETFAEQWEWPGTPENPRQMLFHLLQCETLLQKDLPQYFYISGSPCPPGRERLNYIFRAIFHFDASSFSMTAAFDGEISEKTIPPGAIIVGGIGNWSTSRSSNDSRSISLIFMRELIRIVYTERKQSFYCHYPPAGGILANMVDNARLITEDLSAPRDRRMNAMLNAICEQLKLDIQKFSSAEKQNYPDIVEKAIHYIHLNFQNPINCSSVSEALRINRTMLSGEFHRATGSTMKEFILELRLNKAKWLLESRNFKIREIASQCGFSDPGYFIRVFQEKLGSTPSRYRKNPGIF